MLSPVLPPARLTLFARFPAPGAAKTRLIPAIGAAAAAALHRTLVERTVSQMRASGLPFEVRYTGETAQAFAAWLGSDVPLVDQGAGDLGDRLARVDAPALLIGADAPSFDAGRMERAAHALRDAAAVIGPAEDGGYYLLGLTRPMAFLFEAMPWGTDAVFAETMRRLRTRGIDPTVLETLADIDRPEDLARWPDLWP